MAGTAENGSCVLRIWPILFLCVGFTCAAPPQRQDALFDQAFDALSQETYYSFIRYDLNQLEYSGPGFRKIFPAIRESGHRKVQILHLGDSHVHADSFTGVVREKFQRLFGRAGHGLVFPYAAAKTHSTRFYVSQAFGSWRYNQSVFPPNGLPIGLSGAVIQTSVPGSSVSVAFYDKPPLESPVIKLFCAGDPASFRAAIKTNTGESITQRCAEMVGDSASFNFTRDFQSFSMQTVQDSRTQNYFRLFGFSLERASAGIIYHSAGINGARFSDLAHRQEVAPQMIRSMQPDLVVLDMGINEVYTFRDAPETFEADVRTSISLLRQNSPALPILIMNLPEIYVKSINLNLSDSYTSLLRKIARETNCAFYDTYAISGGRGSMYRWAINGLAGEDFNHLTWKGYEVKADLFVQAFLKSYLIETNSN
ncbi:MAG: hypothetical protein JNM27_04285 [Leptospirales bacterium]|nr:hypothetical protein [Leptospirales bacterium]